MQSFLALNPVGYNYEDPDIEIVDNTVTFNDVSAKFNKVWRNGGLAKLLELSTLSKIEYGNIAIFFYSYFIINIVNIK